ncbi:MAG: hypothetical protein MJ252_06450, partial [archaeon]|nr:hypothetical protein [archaeon]
MSSMLFSSQSKNSIFYPNDSSILECNQKSEIEVNFLIKLTTEIIKYKENNSKYDNKHSLNGNNLSFRNDSNLEEKVSSPDKKEYITVNKPIIENEFLPSCKLHLYENSKICLEDIFHCLKSFGYKIKESLVYLYMNNIEDYIVIKDELKNKSIYFTSAELNFELIDIKIVTFLEEKYLIHSKMSLKEKKDSNPNCERRIK